MRHVTGDPTTGGNDEDITVEFTYTADGQQATITAKQKSPSDDQTTKYVYGTSLSNSDIVRTDLVRAVIYPDSDDSGIGVPPVFSNGPDGIYDRVEHKYNRQGEIKETKDQNETVHAFDFDKLGRQTHDRVTTLGTDIDGAVRRISATYEVRGQIAKITSYDNAIVGSGSVVNEVLREYNDAGLLVREYQEHHGAKDANTLYVGYNYDETASGGEFIKGLRPTSIRYPNGRLVHYTYATSGSDADNLNRLDAIKDDNSGSPGDTLASYTYLGLGQMVIEDYEEPEVKLDYFGGTSGIYAGFDRFNRIIDQRWYDYGASEDRDRFKYGYDRASNRTWKENDVSKNLGTPVYLDEFYTYDGVNRLTNMDRGQVNGTKTSITGTPSLEEDWTLDPLGNWSNYIQKTSGTTDLDQDRTVNKANEITDITETTGTAWATPSHAPAGNMTSIPQSSDPTNDYDLSWDAWNRLVQVKHDTTTIGAYAYDGQTRRILKDVPGSPNSYQHFYYNDQWQVLEARESSTVSVPSTTRYHYTWSPRYIDAPVLRDDIAAEPGERIYYLGDANFNITALVDTSGAVLERYLYDPYGVLTTYDDSWSNTRATSHYANVYTFTGRRLDGETGQYYYRARIYNSGLGSFISGDPIGYEAGLNLREYVGSMPLDALDPIGLFDWKSIIGPGRTAVRWTYHSTRTSLWLDAGSISFRRYASTASKKGTLVTLAGDFHADRYHYASGKTYHKWLTASWKLYIPIECTKDDSSGSSEPSLFVPFDPFEATTSNPTEPTLGVSTPTPISVTGGMSGKYAIELAGEFHLKRFDALVPPRRKCVQVKVKVQARWIRERTFFLSFSRGLSFRPGAFQSANKNQLASHTIAFSMFCCVNCEDESLSTGGHY